MNTIFLEKICRCCLNESDNLTNLFDPITDLDTNIILDETFTFSDAMYLCTNIRCDIHMTNINDAIIELPKFICDICLHELRSALIFRTKCVTNDNLLRDQIVVGCEEIIFEPEETSKIEKNENQSNSVQSNEKTTPNQQSIEVISVPVTNEVILEDEEIKSQQLTEVQNYKKFRCNQCEKEFHTEKIYETHCQHHKNQLTRQK